MEIVDDEGFEVVFDAKVSARFTRFHLSLYSNRSCLPSDIARFLRIFADKMETGKEALVTHDEDEVDH